MKAVEANRMEKKIKGIKNEMKSVQSFFCVELQHLKSSSGGNLSKRKRAGHVKSSKRHVLEYCVYFVHVMKKMTGQT